MFGELVMVGGTRWWSAITSVDFLQAAANVKNLEIERETLPALATRPSCEKVEMW